MNHIFHFFFIIAVIIFCWPQLLFTKVVSGSEINPTIDQQFKSISVLPYFRMHCEYFVALYKKEHTDEYAAIEGKRKRGEKNIAQTAARIFFPLQQHKNIRIGLLDWCSPDYLETMIFKGPWAHSYLLTMNNDNFMYMVDVQRAGSLKKLRLAPMTLVKLEDLLDAIVTGRANENFEEIQLLDSEGHSIQISEKFARGLARSDNWNFLKNFACEDCK